MKRKRADGCEVLAHGAVGSALAHFFSARSTRADVVICIGLHKHPLVYSNRIRWPLSAAICTNVHTQQHENIARMYAHVP